MLKFLWRLLKFGLYTLLGLLATGALLFWYFIHSPDPELPALSGVLSKGTIEVDGMQRSYQYYLPKGLASGAPLVLVMHGSGESAFEIRVGTGYGFERLADQHGFVVVYPNARSFDWNDCGKIGDYRWNGREVDDVGFLSALVEQSIAEFKLDPDRVFATGVSSGGFMAMRLALEAPTRFRAVAAVSANLQTTSNFRCTPTGPGTSVLIMNGTEDPLVPFAGGESSLLGLFFKSGTVRSSQESGQYFADFNKIAEQPVVSHAGTNVEQALWRGDSGPEVELVTILGGGHGLPQPYWRRPRLLGPSPMAPNGPELIWAFFERQTR